MPAAGDHRSSLVSGSVRHYGTPHVVETRTPPSRRLQSAHAATRRRLSINSGDGEKSDDHADDRRRHYRSSDSALLLKDGHRWVCWVRVVTSGVVGLLALDRGLATIRGRSEPVTRRSGPIGCGGVAVGC
jgi:hypothetical protein